MPETPSDRCPRISAVGTPCDLEVGHEGPHIRHYPDHPGYPPSRWTDEGDAKFMEAEGDKRLGT